jgi:formylglycine-generating enzyme required for sulfatase activity
MRPNVLLLLALVSPTWAADLPSIDTPLKTGLSAKADAAVVIGVEHYGYLPSVPYAERDAQAMYDFLLYTRGVRSSRITLLKGANSRKKIRDAVAEAGEGVGPGGTMWVYFAGHGTASPSTKERLLLPENTPADADGYEESGVKVSELQRLAGAGGGEVILITDACFTGAGRDGSTLVAGGRSFVPGVATAVGGAAQWDAAQPNQVAGPLDAVQHGAFTYFAIGAMRGWADGQLSGSRDEVVTTEEANAYVDEALRSVGIRDQRPSLVGASSYERTLASGPKLERAPVLAALVAPRGRESTDGAVAMSPQSGGTTFGVGSGLSASEKLAAQRCDDASRITADEAHAKKLARAVSAVQASATTAWQALEPELTSCVELRATADRAACAAQADGFAKKGKTAVATLSTHTEVVPSDCGPRERTYEAETVRVTVAEVAWAEALAAKLRQAPAAAASAAVTATGSSSYSASGRDWMSPSFGLMKWIPAGSFTMGSAEGVGEEDEYPAHKVTLTGGFWLMEHEVTQGEWASVMGSNPSHFSKCGSTCPVEMVSWEDAQAFIWKVSSRDGVSYRLPTEAEWEYGARGGQSYEYAGSNQLGDVAWYGGNSGNTPHPVCGKSRNGYGLCDMSGNVMEVVADRYGTFPSGAVTNPGGVSAGSYRVYRGGNYYYSPGTARVAARYGGPPDWRGNVLGLRLARTGP